MMLNRQEIFNIVYKGLRTQGWERSVEHDASKNKGICVYRTSDGKKCAFGHLIPDEVYESGMENIIAINLLDSGVTKFKDFRKWSDENIKKQYHSFINDLQCQHDYAISPEDMKNRFHKLAIDYNLQVPE